MTINIIPEKDADGNIITRVLTEFENPALVPKFACASNTFSGNTCTIDFKVPGTFGVDKRYIKDGYLFTDAFYAGDRITKCQVIDIDDKVGYGANTILKSYIDEDAPSANQGWYLWPTGGGVGGELDVENAGGTGELLAELYFRIEIEKNALSAASKAFVNIFWCIKE